MTRSEPISADLNAAEHYDFEVPKGAHCAAPVANREDARLMSVNQRETTLSTTTFATCWSCWFQAIAWSSITRK